MTRRPGRGRVARGGALVALALLLVAGLGCQPEQHGPTTEDFTREREALMARLKKKKAANPTTATAAPAAPAESTEPAFAVVDERWSYDPEGKRDPFRSIEWEQKDQLAMEARGPLEQFDVNQLELAAVVWKTGRARGLIEDPSGQSYIVEVGTPIGKNEGRVTRIREDSMVVKETYVDLMGQETTKDIEMRVSRN